MHLLSLNFTELVETCLREKGKTLDTESFLVRVDITEWVSCAASRPEVGVRADALVLGVLQRRIVIVRGERRSKDLGKV